MTTSYNQAMAFGFRLPKDDKKYHWTQHIKDKMIFYRIPESVVKRIINYPSRQEIGIAESTVAAMRQNSTSKKKEEIWVMYVVNSKGKSQNSKLKLKRQNIENSQSVIRNSKFTLISTWRYPGHTKDGQKLPLEILQEINEAKMNF